MVNSIRNEKIVKLGAAEYQWLDSYPALPTQEPKKNTCPGSVFESLQMQAFQVIVATGFLLVEKIRKPKTYFSHVEKIGKSSLAMINSHVGPEKDQKDISCPKNSLVEKIRNQKSSFITYYIIILIYPYSYPTMYNIHTYTHRHPFLYTLILYNYIPLHISCISWYMCHILATTSFLFVHLDINFYLVTRHIDAAWDDCVGLWSPESSHLQFHLPGDGHGLLAVASTIFLSKKHGIFGLFVGIFYFFKGHLWILFYFCWDSWVVIS